MEDRKNGISYFCTIFLSAIFLSDILLRYQNPHIANVIACRPGDDRVAESLEEIERIAVSAKNVRRRLHRHSPIDGGAISDRSVGGAVPVNAVRARAQNDHVFYSVQHHRRAQRELLIAPALAVATHGANYFSA